MLDFLVERLGSAPWDKPAAATAAPPAVSL